MSGWTFPSHEEVKRHIEDQEREATKETEISFPSLVTSLIVFSAFAAFFATFSSGNPEVVFESYGLIPSKLMELKDLHTVLTHMFLHASFEHILVNMFVFLLFGSQCEQRMGKLRFLLFYILSGVSAALFHLVFNVSSDVPVVGASGAIFGVLAAFVVFFPDKEVTLYLVVVPIRLPAIVAIPVVFVLQTVFAIVIASSNIAYMAHIGGFISGIVLTALMYPKPAKDFLITLLDVLVPYVPQAPPGGK